MCVICSTNFDCRILTQQIVCGRVQQTQVADFSVFDFCPCLCRVFRIFFECVHHVGVVFRFSSFGVTMRAIPFQVYIYLVFEERERERERTIDGYGTWETNAEFAR